ncbi:hybrid sensor histidine kinase/response regulator transcription factor [Filimonas effusa]|uniref:histidine kinase n=1 Tax=Filimonas effusa TaxID=2508721 RepID=A0A4Q1D6K8_9BACT|nr:two-component regulator propeller domain-containing protein [Filimonas effusa]RXK83626.1 hybrid sensor histidine kinase/response regulator [Filimonas effusa]
MSLFPPGWYRLLLICLLNPFILLSQDYAVRYLDIGQGLSNNSVMNIYQDAQGYMWFGTYDGLNRYNGYDFEVYRNNIGDTNSLLSNSIYCITGDAANNLFVGGQIGVSVFNAARSKFSRLWYTPAGKTSAEPVSDIVHHVKALGNNALLVGSHNLGLLLFRQGATHTGEQVPLVAGSKKSYRYNVSGIEPVSDHEAWIFIDKKGLYFFNSKTAELRAVNTQLTQTTCIRKDSTGRLWLGTNDGLYCLESKTGALLSGFLPPHHSVVNVLVEKQGSLLLGTDGAGVWQLPYGTAKATPLKGNLVTPLVKSNAVWSIFEDRDGRKWFATLRGGISVMEPAGKFFTHIKYNNAAGPADNFILSFCEDRSGNVWIGTDGAGLRYWNRKNNSFSTIPAAHISSSFITSMVYDDQEDLWISTWSGGINRMKKGTGNIERFTCYNPVTKQQEPNIWLLYKDSHKNIWASATNQGSLYLFNREWQQFQLFDPVVKDIQSMIETRDGNMWMGDYNSLYRIDPLSHNRQVYSIGYPVRSLLEDKTGRLWVGTQEGGLLLFDRRTGNYKRFTQKDGMPSNTVLRLLEDQQGYLWMSSYNGISRFDPAKTVFQNFSQSDGLQSNQFSFNAGLALSSGEFLFGGINGFNIFSPSGLSGHSIPLTPLLSGIAVNNNPITGDNMLERTPGKAGIRSIRLPFEQANLSLDFVALNYSGSDKVNYAYLLEGWDKDWNYTGKSRRANYSRLHEGSYIFKVKVSDDGGRWGNETSLLQVQVLPPWYRTWWAYLLFFMMVTGVLYGYIIYARRQERLRYEVRLAHLEGEKEKELAERQLSVFTNIAHEFRSPLTLIINPLKKAISGKNDPDAKAQQADDLAAAHRNARRLLGLVDQLLLFRKTDSGAYQLQISKVDLVNLCNDVFLCFKNLAREKNIRYHFEAPGDPVFAAVDFEKLEIAVFNLVANAFKFTPDGGAIRITLSAAHDQATISVSDTGPGIALADQERIFEKFGQGSTRTPGKTGFGIGLFLSRNFVEKHRGTIACQSEPGNGAAFIIKLPLQLEAIEQATNNPHTPQGKTELVEEMMADDTAAHTETGPVVANVVKPAAASRISGVSVDDLVTEKSVILIVDDNEELRSYLLRLFSDKYLVLGSSNGADALQLAKERMPDLIVSDISMDGMDGLELCRHIKETEELSHIPVILLTAATGIETKLQGISGGADDFITKPFDSDILLARAATLLKNRSQLRKYFLNSITLRENSFKVPVEDQEFLKQCIQLVEAGIGKEDFNIKSFARSMGMSHSALYTRIKALSGQTVNAFIRSIRLRRAAVLMLTENMNVTEAGFQVGFEDVRYFREQFTKLFGMTPSDYIKKYRNSFNRELNTIRRKEV